MKICRPARLMPLIAIVAACSMPNAAFADEPAPSSLDCTTGPVTRTFGGTQWLVYSCDDRKSMVVVSAEGNPAAPFVFILMPGDNAYSIYGEGTGDKKASGAAYDALTHLPLSALLDLLKETQQAQGKEK